MNKLSVTSVIFQQELSKMPKLGLLSGPTIAKEVSQYLPTTEVLACNDKQT